MRETSDSKVEKKESPQKFTPNNRYFTISIYVIAVVTICALIIRVIMTPMAVTTALKQALNVLMPFLIGLLIALVLHPIIQKIMELLMGPCKIKSEKLCKVLSIVISYLLVLGLLAICIGYIIPQIVVSVTEVVNSLPKLYQMTYDFFNNLEAHFPNADISEMEKVVTDTLPGFIDSFKNIASDMVPAIYNASVSFVKLFLNLIIAIIVSIYMLIDKKQLLHSMKRLIYCFVPEKYIRPTLEVFAECNHIFTNFITGKAIDSTIIGILCFILMSIFRMPYAMLISVIVGVTNMIPYFGPFIGAIPGILVLLMVSPLESLGFAVMILALQQFDGLYLGPKILGGSVGIKPLWIIISITIGGSIGGVLGMFLSVPIFAILSYLVDLILTHRLKRRNIKY